MYDDKKRQKTNSYKKKDSDNNVGSQTAFVIEIKLKDNGPTLGLKLES